MVERLTEHSKQTSHENGICCTHFCGPECIEVGGNCAMNCKWEEEVWSRLAAYEDTGLTPGDIKELLDMAVSKTDKVLRLKEELQGAKNTAEQYAAINETLFDSNMKLGADRKDLINELCQYCGKYKYAHEGACAGDGCRWRDM